jgi:acetylornithine deacetylase/succinyl-diaminopimelate desuccinylase-like protein
VQKNTPKGIHFEVRVLSAGPGLVVNPDHPAIKVAAKAFSDILGKKTVFIRSGGSIPIVGDFANHLGIPTVLMGFGLPDDGLHSPNEKYHLENYYKGIMTIAHFFEQYGAAVIAAELSHDEEMVTLGTLRRSDGKRASSSQSVSQTWGKDLLGTCY